MNTTGIRDALYAVVTAATTFSESNTMKSRYAGENVTITTMPQAWVGFVNEERDIAEIGATREYDAVGTWEITVMSVAADGSTMDETLDGYVTEIEAQLTDRELGGIVRDALITGIAYDINAEGEERVGTATITVAVMGAGTSTT